MHVVDVKASARKGSGHFRLRIDAFLAKHAHLRAHARRNEGRGRIGFNVVRRLREEPRIGRIGNARKFLIGASRIVAAARDDMRDFAPSRLQRRTLEDGDRLAVVLETQFVGVDRFTDKVRAVRKAFGAHLRDDLFYAIGANLQHGTELFVKERIENGCVLFLQERIERSANADARSKVHFGKRRKRPPSPLSW